MTHPTLIPTTQFEMLRAATERRQTPTAPQPPEPTPDPHTLACRIVHHSLGARAAYNYLDELTRAVGEELKKKGLP
jgi:hypothetical protein